MKKTLLLSVFFFLFSELFAQTIATVSSASNHPTLRVYRIIDDTKVAVKEYDCNTLFEKDVYGNGVELAVYNNEINLSYKDKTLQYSVNEKAEISKSTKKLLSAKELEEKNKAELKLIAAYGKKNDIQPYNGWDYWSSLAGIGNNIYLWRSGSGNAWIVRKQNNSYEMTDLGDDYEISLNAVAYSTDRIAYLTNSTVRRIDISDFKNPVLSTAVIDEFKAAVSDKNTSNLKDIFNFQLTPDYLFDRRNWDESVMSLIIETKSPEFILECFKEIDKSYGIPYSSFGGAYNPVLDIINAKDVKSLETVLAWKGTLANFVSYNGVGENCSPIKYAVETKDVNIVKAMLPYVKDINNVRCLTYKQEEGGGSYRNACNLLSFAESDEMKKILIDAGVKTYIPYTSNYEKKTTINDYRINVRDKPGLNGKKIDQLNYNDEVEVLGVDPYFVEIDDYKGHWIHIKFKDGKTGYVFEKYLNQYFQ